MKLAKSTKRAGQRGFTLVELLMATTAGLVVSAAAFLLAKNASAVFQEEARITAAQLSASLGLQRIATDISRAGFLTSPNVVTDPFVCHEDGSWPALLLNLKALDIEKGGSVTAHGAELAQSTANGFSPDRITIASSFDSAEMLPVRTIQPGAGGNVVYLQTAGSPMTRLCKGATLADCNLPGNGLQRVFKTGRLLRILTRDGNQIFGVVGGVTVQPDSVAVQLDATPIVPVVAFNPRGYSGDCKGCLVNTVSVVRYELQSLVGDPSYGALVAPVAAAATGDGGRTELVRVELDNQGLPIAGTLELVAELAVDLKFGISTVDVATSTVTDLPIAAPEDDAIYTTNPERIRSVHVRFSTRARVPDRDTDLGGGPGPDGRRHRFQIPIFGKPTYARMRTLYTEVALQNLVKATW